jgi:MFS superfamily sulfate permease-like transporter
MNSTSNGVTAVEVAQLIACILGVVFGLAGILTLTPGWAIMGAVLVLLGLGCFALQQALGD